MKKLILINDVWKNLEVEKDELDTNYKYVINEILLFKHKISKIKKFTQSNKVKNNRLCSKINSLLLNHHKNSKK